MLRAESGTVPEDLVLEVRYGGGVEEYRRTDPATPRIVFCEDSVDGGFDAVRCDLWTNGAASITVTGSGLSTMRRDLSATFDDPCDDVMTEELVVDLAVSDEN